MERRSFIAALFGGAAAAPVIAQEALAPSIGGLASLGRGYPLLEDGFDSFVAPLLPARMSFGVTGRGDNVYRTGDPAIDALRSVSGVYKALMERRKAR